MRLLPVLILGTALTGCGLLNMKPTAHNTVAPTTQPADAVETEQSNATGQMAANVNLKREQGAAQSHGDRSPVITINGGDWPLMVFLTLAMLVLGVPWVWSKVRRQRRPEKFMHRERCHAHCRSHHPQQLVR